MKTQVRNALEDSDNRYYVEFYDNLSELIEERGMTLDDLEKEVTSDIDNLNLIQPIAVYEKSDTVFMNIVNTTGKNAQQIISELERN